MRFSEDSEMTQRWRVSNNRSLVWNLVYDECDPSDKSDIHLRLPDASCLIEAQMWSVGCVGVR